MSRQVVVLPEAERNVHATLSWLQERSPAGAESWFHAWEDMLRQLCRIATSCVLAPESSTRDIEIRQILFKTRKGRPYRALFTIRDEIVYVMHVRGPRQNLMSADEIAEPPES